MSSQPNTKSGSLVWLITGTSTGLGRELAIAALKRGEKVIATSRAKSLLSLDDLKTQGAETLELDVTSSLEELKLVAQKAVDIYGRVDVVVNNAGYLLQGAVEENTPEETLAQFNTNVLGALNVARAFLPHMRERKTGTIVWAGSLGAWQGYAGAGLYCSTKFAIRCVSLSLQMELEPLGLRSICVDFGYFRTNLLEQTNRAKQTGRIQDYAETIDQADSALAAYSGNQPGDPVKGAERVLDIVRGEGEAKGKAWPKTGVRLGTDVYEAVKLECESTLADLEEWKDVTCSTDL